MHRLPSAALLLGLFCSLQAKPGSARASLPAPAPASGDAARAASPLVVAADSADDRDFGGLFEKRDADEFDPRFLSSAFGKRAGIDVAADPRLYSAAFGKRNSEWEDPRFMSAAFGKRSAVDFDDPRSCDTVYMNIICRLLSASFGKRELDPRMFSSSFGKRNPEELDPRFFSASFGKRSDEFDDPRFFSAAFGKRSDDIDPRFLSASFGKRSM